MWHHHDRITSFRAACCVNISNHIFILLKTSDWMVELWWLGTLLITLHLYSAHTSLDHWSVRALLVFHCIKPCVYAHVLSLQERLRGAIHTRYLDLCPPLPLLVCNGASTFCFRCTIQSRWNLQTMKKRMVRSNLNIYIYINMPPPDCQRISFFLSEINNFTTASLHLLHPQILYRISMLVLTISLMILVWSFIMYPDCGLTSGYGCVARQGSCNLLWIPTEHENSAS